MFDPIKEEDYQEYCCNEAPKRVSIDRVLEKFDYYIDENNIEGAKRHLLYWIEESKVLKDDINTLRLYNELIGVERKEGRMDECLNAINNSLDLIKKIYPSFQIDIGTVYVNIATGYKAFNFSSEALLYYNKAKEILEAKLDTNDFRLSSLYNNMGITLTDFKDYVKAKEYFDKSIDILNNIGGHELEIAIGYLNICDLIEKEKGIVDEIYTLLDKAYRILKDDNIKKDEYYRFVVSKCLPSFKYYNDLFKYNELKRRIE